MALQVEELRTQVDPHWTRGLGYLKIGLRWLQGAVNKSRKLLMSVSLLTSAPDSCFSFKKACAQYDVRAWFTRIQSLRCRLERSLLFSLLQ